jgi:perosamine synthetase
MTNMQAALGLAQLECLGESVKRKREIGRQYNELLESMSGIQLPHKKSGYADNIYWVYGLVLDNSISFNAEEAIRRLAEKGIGTRPFFCPMHMQPILRRMGLFEGESYPVAEWLYQLGLYIPSGMALTDEEIEKVAATVSEVLT